MKVKVYGRGHDSGGATPSRRHRKHAPIRIGVFRRGGMGDGLMEGAVITALKREIPESSITGYADMPFYKILMGHPDCSFVRAMPWSTGMSTEVQVRHATMISDELDLWFDAKPVPFIDGRNCDRHFDTTHLGELADIEGRYYRFNGDEIIDLYRRHGCYGQLDLISKLFGFDASIRDAYLQRERPPSKFALPSSYATISAGWTDTSHYKGWTVEGWAEVSHWLSTQGICPVQVGLADEPEIPGTMSARSLDLPQQVDIICGAMLHAGSDGFLCHVSSAADVPTVVLWGPTPHEVWGHPGQVAVVSPISRNVWWTHYHWAHDPACQDMMRAIDPDAVMDGICRSLRGVETERGGPSVSFSAEKLPCVLAQVQGGFGDALVAMSKLKATVDPDDRVVVVVVPDGNGNVENARRCCAMFSIVDDLLVEIGRPLNEAMASDVVERRLPSLELDRFLDLRAASAISLPDGFSTLAIDDLESPPTLPDWIPDGPICCLQPATRQHKDESASWGSYADTMRAIEERIGMPVVLLGGRSDLVHVSEEPSLGVNAIGRLTFEESLSLVASSAVGIAMDSWVAHCAAAFGRVGIYVQQDSTLPEFLEFLRCIGGSIVTAAVDPTFVCRIISDRVGRR